MTGSGVYLIENNTKRPFDSVEALYSHGYTWPDVLTVPDSILATIPAGAPLSLNIAAYADKLIKGPSTGAGVFLVKDNTKRPFESAEALYSYGYKWTNVVTVTQYVLDNIPLGAPLSVRQ
jgi:hypothetical protein